jgi:hypothetical protein
MGHLSKTQMSLTLYEEILLSTMTFVCLEVVEKKQLVTRRGEYVS